MRILLVCTGNLCRSPVAERMLAHWARDALGDDAARVALDSAGTDAPHGRPMDDAAAHALLALGGDPVGFTSRRLVAGEAMEFDLVLTATREHRSRVLYPAPGALRRTFTFVEAAALLAVADCSGIGELPLEARARELSARLSAARAHRRSGDADDIADPIGRSLMVHRAVADRIAEALSPLATVLFQPEQLPPR
ncbi:low molecular weight phosphatase family protein [Goekera deserti]|uniref:Low molecular weight phosphatase family protein n=1 Tax=Goekera deserti TaxID=2497753 RepID=A0A7K3WF55_9ACTN|nr:low molecular weight phosphatase family protein [Goekera deserti]NDI48584.1 low molecular weight phosphatase family protein [Goekera deserti]NEL55037.1 low molecular weight phosphatase family protein [Goekera deserti]